MKVAMGQINDALSIPDRTKAVRIQKIVTHADLKLTFRPHRLKSEF